MKKFDVSVIREDFPLLKQKTTGLPLVYLDSGATAQKPQTVLDVVDYYYEHDNANVHRGVYALSERATKSYEGVREKVKNLINAEHLHEIIFTSGTTDSINLVAFTYGVLKIKAGDEIIISAMEHHSNIVPWQLLCERTGATLKVIPVNDDGSLNLEDYKSLISEKTRLVSLVHVSNVLGTINPVKEIIEIAHQHDIPVLLDGAQAVPHLRIDVQDLDCDFYAFSSHKLYGPTGAGVLYGKTKWLEQMPPYQGGGEMISRVSFSKTEYNTLPHKFEAGTPNMAGVIGMGAAIDYVNQVGLEKIAAHESALTSYATELLEQIPGLRIIGNAPHKASVISFVMEQAHPHDIGTILDHENIAIRAGHHCAMPLVERFNVPATARVSFGMYNNQQEVDRLVAALYKVIEIFGKK